METKVKGQLTLETLMQTLIVNGREDLLTLAFKHDNEMNEMFPSGLTVTVNVNKELALRLLAEDEEYEVKNKGYHDYYTNAVIIAVSPLSLENTYYIQFTNGESKYFSKYSVEKSAYTATKIIKKIQPTLTTNDGIAAVEAN